MTIYVHIYLCFKSHILIRNDGPERPKHVAFIDDIIKVLLCLTVIYMPQHNGMDSMKKEV